MEIRMKPVNFVLFLIAFGFSFISAEDSSENENHTKTPSEGNLEVTESKPVEKHTNFPTRQRQPDNLITPDQQLTIEPRLFYSQPGKDSEVPDLRFPIHGNRRQNIYLTDHTGKYNIRLQNVEGTPQNFQAALGAISAHILNHKSNQEYIPYPPNGNPYNYPAYRGHPRATEPPVIGAYERVSNSNYDVGPVDFGQQDPRRFFSPDYQTGFTNQFQAFGQGVYNPTGLFNDRALHTEIRRSSYPVEDSSWYNQREELQRPIK